MKLESNPSAGEWGKGSSLIAARIWLPQNMVPQTCFLYYQRQDRVLCYEVATTPLLEYHDSFWPQIPGWGKANCFFKVRSRRILISVLCSFKHVVVSAKLGMMPHITVPSIHPQRVSPTCEDALLEQTPVNWTTVKPMGVD